MKPKKESEKFLLAINSIFFALKTQPHLQFHILASSIAIILGILCNISQVEWMILVIVIFGVLITEMINTAFETTINLITSDYHPLAKTGKDIASGAVFLAAITAIIVGSLIFYPKFDTLLSGRWPFFG